MTTEVRSCLNGIYPRSEALVRATRDYDRKRIGLQDLERQFRRDLEGLVALQQDVGLDYLSDGMLRWQDMFRPLVEACEGLDVGPLTRFFDNNTFFRQPVVNGALKHKAPADSYYNVEAFPEDARWKAVLPSPYAFSRMAEGQGHAYSDPNELMFALAEEILRPELERLVKRGCSFIQLNEPYLAYHQDPSPEDLAGFREAIRLLAEGVRPRAKLCLHTYFGDVSPFAGELLEFEIDVLGVDFLATDLESLPPFRGKELLCGCLDARSSLPEDPEIVSRFIKRVREKLAPKAMYITSNADLEFLPERIAREKVRLMATLAHHLMEEGEGT
jgi:5-methyltetrahydropteroyltriglutamate--homocysteine methyltransferase